MLAVITYRKSQNCSKKSVRPFSILLCSMARPTYVLDLEELLGCRVERGRRLEIEELLGYVVRKGKEAGRHGADARR